MGGMKFTIRPGASTSSGGVAVVASEAREALDLVREMMDRGLTDIEVFDDEGRLVELAELERASATEAE
jgi:hypothetical protein